MVITVSYPDKYKCGKCLRTYDFKKDAEACEQQVTEPSIYPIGSMVMLMHQFGDSPFICTEHIPENHFMWSTVTNGDRTYNIINESTIARLPTKGEFNLYKSVFEVMRRRMINGLTEE